MLEALIRAHFTARARLYVAFIKHHSMKTKCQSSANNDMVPQCLPLPIETVLITSKGSIRWQFALTHWAFLVVPGMFPLDKNIWTDDEGM
jgi:hypothetical protein